MRDTEHGLALGTEIQGALAEIAFHVAEQYHTDFFLAVGAHRIDIFSLIEHNHRITAFRLLSDNIYLLVVGKFS